MSLLEVDFKNHSRSPQGHNQPLLASLLKHGGPPPPSFFQRLITHYPNAIDAILPLAILWTV